MVGRSLPRSLLALSVLLTPLAALAQERAPYPLKVRVLYGDANRGPQSVIDQLETLLVPALGHQACFGEVTKLAPGEEAADGLLLRVVLDELSEKIFYEASVHARANPIDPAVRRDLIAEFRTRFRFDLLQLPESVSVRGGGRRILQTVRPLLPEHEDEYARAEARRRAVREIAELTVRKVCKGSPGKLDKAIDKALEGS
jgi:hypothetical protein